MSDNYDRHCCLSRITRLISIESQPKKDVIVGIVVVFGFVVVGLVVVIGVFVVIVGHRNQI